MKVAVSLAKKYFGSIRNNCSCLGNQCRNSNKIHGSGTTTLIIPNEEMNDIKAIKNETKEQKGGLLSMLLGTLGASLLGNLQTGKRIVRAGYGPHPWTNFEIQKYYENEPIFNNVFSRDNLPKTIKMVLM